MTVAELISELKELEPDRLVVMSRDSEGNGFSPLDGVGACKYEAHCTWAGDTGLEELTDDLTKQGFTDEDVMVGGVKAVCLWPTN